MGRFIIKILLWIMAIIRNRYIHIRDQLQTKEITYKLKKCGKDVRFRYPCDIAGADNMEIENNTYINRGAFIRAQGGLRIGENVHIARNVTIYTYNHNYLGDALPYDHTLIKKPVVIERNVWIGINVTIVPGVRIGEGAIIGAGTIVSQDIPPLAIVGSQPPRIIKYRDQLHYDELDKIGRYGGLSGKLYIVTKP